MKKRRLLIALATALALVIPLSKPAPLNVYAEAYQENDVTASTILQEGDKLLFPAWAPKTQGMLIRYFNEKSEVRQTVNARSGEDYVIPDYDSLNISDPIPTGKKFAGWSVIGKPNSQSSELQWDLKRCLEAAPDPTPEPTDQPEPTEEPNPTDTPTIAPEPTDTPTTAPAPTDTPTTAPISTAVPTIAPTAVPTALPTVVPTGMPTQAPTAVPTAVPTAKPTEVPTPVPTFAPTAVPTVIPTVAPTGMPTQAPTAVPTVVPTVVPTAVPTDKPAVIPTPAPTLAPTAVPTAIPTAAPTETPVQIPTTAPTVSPSTPAPTLVPTPTPEPDIPNTVISQAGTYELQPYIMYLLKGGITHVEGDITNYANPISFTVDSSSVYTFY